MAPITTTPRLYEAIIPGVPLAARALIWEVFFASRQRGVDLRTHFPWIEQSMDTHCLTLSEKEGGSAVASLVLRQRTHSPVGSCAMVGMVCVDLAWRGRGLATRLLRRAHAFAIAQQFPALVLWTGQPGIYRRHGFVPDKCDSLGQVTLDPLRLRAHVKFSKGQSHAARGLPPFAERLVYVESAAAQLITLETACEVALAEWQGSLPAVLDLIEVALPTTWHLNAPADAPIFEELHKRGHSYTPSPCATRMSLHLGPPATIPYISVLDRI